MLRSKYDNIKKGLRQKHARERCERMRTGGGKAQEPLSSKSEALAELEQTISLTVTGHESQVDDDNSEEECFESEKHQEDEIETEFLESENENDGIATLLGSLDNDNECSDFEIIECRSPSQCLSTCFIHSRPQSEPCDKSKWKSNISLATSKSVPESSSNMKRWNKYTPDSLKNPITPVLKTKRLKGKSHHESDEESLMNLKKKFIRRETELMEERSVREKEQHRMMQEEHELKMKILQIEYETKKIDDE